MEFPSRFRFKSDAEHLDHIQDRNIHLRIPLAIGCKHVRQNICGKRQHGGNVSTSECRRTRKHWTDSAMA